MYQLGVASLKVTLTVWSSSASTVATSCRASTVVAAVSLSVTYRWVKTTSRAVKGWPSLHLTPCFSFQVTLLRSRASPPFCSEGISAARKGTSFSSGPKAASGS